MKTGELDNYMCYEQAYLKGKTNVFGEVNEESYKKNIESSQSQHDQDELHDNPKLKKETQGENIQRREGL